MLGIIVGQAFGFKALYKITLGVFAAAVLFAVPEPLSAAEDDTAPGVSSPPQLGKDPYRVDSVPDDNAAAAVGAAGLFSNLEPYFRLGFGGGRIFDNNDDSALSLEDPIGEAVISGTIGVNLNRHISTEVAIEFIETNLNSPHFNKIAELAVWNILLQARYRVQVGRRLEPYLLAGVGMSLTEVNDFAAGGRAHPVLDRTDISFVGSVGAGLDYFFANNLAVGLESKFFYGARADMFFDGAERDLDLDGVITTVGLRMLLNAKDRETGGPLPAPRDSDRWRVYLALQAGYPYYMNTSITPALKHDAPANDVLFGFSAGLNMGRYFGLEIAGGGGETALISNTGAGTVSELAFWTVTGQARVRYPIMNDRLSPYLIAGGGLGWSQVNDRSVALSVFDIAGPTDSSPVVTAGVGLDYFIAHNIAINLEGKQTFFFDRDIRVQGVMTPVDLSFFNFTGGLRLFLN